MWASASLAGTAAGVTSSLLGTTMANLVGASFLLYAIFSKQERDQSKEAMMARINEKYGHDNLDVARGLLVVTCFPVIIAYFLLAALKQLVRRTGVNPCSRSAREAHDPDTRAGIVTVEAKTALARMRTWDRARVLTYAVYWGIGACVVFPGRCRCRLIWAAAACRSSARELTPSINLAAAYMTLQVLVANLTVVFLSWYVAFCGAAHLVGGRSSTSDLRGGPYVNASAG